MALVAKNPPANAGDARDSGLTPDLEDTLEEEMATHSSILAWRIPWTEERGGLPSVGLHTVGPEWSDLAHTHTHTVLSVQLNVIMSDTCACVCMR